MPQTLHVVDSSFDKALELDKITKVSNLVWGFFERLGAPGGAAIPTIEDDVKKRELADRLSALEWATARRRPRRRPVSIDTVSDLVSKAGYGRLAA